MDENKCLFAMNGMLKTDICHHGVKGQKWGVRRYQNPDGSLTPEGRKRVRYRNNIVRNRQYTDDVNEIVRTLTKKEKKLLGASLNEDWIEKEYEDQILINKAKTFVTKCNNIPISFAEIWTNGGKTGQIAIATRNQKSFRNKGYASKEVQKVIDWASKYGVRSIDSLEWIAEESNVSSRKLAEKYGFKKDEEQPDKGYVYYHRQLKNG